MLKKKSVVSFSPYSVFCLVRRYETTVLGKRTYTV